MRFCVALIVLICALAPNLVRAEATGLVITDPQTLRDLDGGGFGLGQMLAPSRAASLSNEALFALPAMAPVRRALEAEFTRYIERN